MGPSGRLDILIDHGDPTFCATGPCHYDKSTVPLEIKEAQSKIRNRANRFDVGLLQLMSDSSTE